jgi:hypothetical protein
VTATRLNVPVLVELVDAQRQARGLSWSALGRQVGMTSNAFVRMRHGRAPDAHGLLALLLWLGWAPELVLLVGPGGGS